MTHNIPPKQTVGGAGADAPPLGTPLAGQPAQESGALVSIHNAALHATPESFPVLKAFQDYLEAERKRARQRLIMLSAFFAILLIAVMLGLIGIGVYLFGNMSKTQNQLLQAVLEQRAAPLPAPAAAPDAAAIAGVLEERLGAKLAAVSLPAPAPTDTTTSAELAAIKATLAALQKENEELKAKPKPRPSVGPVTPRAAVAHLLDKPTPPAASPPATAVAAAAPVAALQPAPAPQAPTAPPTATAVPAPAAATTAAAPAEKPRPTTDPDLVAAYRVQDNRMIVEVPSQTSEMLIPWRVVLPPR